jgi:hypothetical protein
MQINSRFVHQYVITPNPILRIRRRSVRARAIIATYAVRRELKFVDLEKTPKVSQRTLGKPNKFVCLHLNRVC